MENQQQPGYPSLTKSYKGRFPFKIATTSFIYPDHYIPNVKMLGPYMDEIELLLFESTGPDALPSRSVIAELGRLAGEFDLSYNVHLPTDISISDPNPGLQKQAVATMLRVMERVSPLDPSALILHIPWIGSSLDTSSVSRWQDRVYHNLKKMVSAIEKEGVIAVETLDYPLKLLDDIIADLKLAICLDLGHLLVYGYNVTEVFSRYGHQTSVLHLHGIENGRDHVALDRLPDESAQSVLGVLKNFTGVASVEVFSFENLQSSLNFLESQWEARNPCQATS